MDLRFCFKQLPLVLEFFKVNKILNNVSCETKFLLPLTENLCTPWLMLLVVGKELYLHYLSYAKYPLITSPWLGVKVISQKRYLWDNRAYFTRKTQGFAHKNLDCNRYNIWSLSDSNGTSDFSSVLNKEFLDIQANIECRFTQKHIRDMIKRYSHGHRIDKYLQYSPIIWPVWLNGECLFTN